MIADFVYLKINKVTEIPNVFISVAVLWKNTRGVYFMRSAVALRGPSLRSAAIQRTLLYLLPTAVCAAAQIPVSDFKLRV